jgi:SpoVK/Ycf46/Vps4 family AAA+-type ATPase
MFFNLFGPSAPTSSTTAVDLARLYNSRGQVMSDDAIAQGSKLVARYSNPAGTPENHFQRISALMNETGFSTDEQQFMRLCCGLCAKDAPSNDHMRRSDRHLMQAVGVHLRRTARAKVESSLALARQHLAQCPYNNEVQTRSIQLTQNALALARIAFEPDSPQLRWVHDEVTSLRHSHGSSPAGDNAAVTPAPSLAALPPGEGQQRLNAMVGLENVKEEIKSLVALATLTQREAPNINDMSPDISLNAFFGGRPGTGKTQVARIYGSLLRDAGVLTSGHVVVASKGDLVGLFEGHTTQKTRKLVEQAQGGVLLIDEAHLLASGENDRFAKEAISQLMIAMVDYKGQFAVIFATYTEKRETLFAVDPGFARRVSTQLEFPDYTDEELATILTRMAAAKRYEIAADVAHMTAGKIGEGRHAEGFGNAGSIEAAFDRALKLRARRIIENSEAGRPGTDELDRTLMAADFSGLEVLTGGHFNAQDKHLALPKGEAQARLDAMVGLTSVKEEICDLVAMSELTGVEAAKDPLKNAGLNLHAFFGGNPGTGKTQIALLYGSLLRDAGLLKSGHVIVASKADLEGKYIGDGATKARKLVQRALGGVLFIDEAHLFTEATTNCNSTQAISELMLAMLKYKDEFAVVFATYPRYESAFFALDPGLRRRIPNHLSFPDYTDGELELIVSRMAQQRGYTVSAAVAAAVGTHVGRSRASANFGNAGDVETALDQAAKKRARRLTAARTGALHPSGNRALLREDFFGPQPGAALREPSRMPHLF